MPMVEALDTMRGAMHFWTDGARKLLVFARRCSRPLDTPAGSAINGAA